MIEHTNKQTNRDYKLYINDRLDTINKKMFEKFRRLNIFNVDNLSLC